MVIQTLSENRFEIGTVFLYAATWCIGMAVSFFLLTIYSRKRKIRVQNLLNKYEPIVENMLMTVLFMDMDYESVKDKPEYHPFLTIKSFRISLMNSVINLHQNYDGSYAKRLEKFYSDSNLMQDSLTKLKSSKWEVKCKGITELAEMDVTPIFDELVKLTVEKNKTIEIVAMSALMKLDATRGITYLVEHKHPITDWGQLNIIDALKRGDIEDIQGIELLLASENESVISLGLKIIQSFDLSVHHPYVLDLIAKTKEVNLKAEANRVAKLLSNPFSIV